MARVACLVSLMQAAVWTGVAANDSYKYSTTGFDQPIYEGNVLKAMFHGGSGHPLLGDRNQIAVENGYWIKTFRDGDVSKLESIAEGSRCMFNVKPHNNVKAYSISSDDPITLHALASGDSAAGTNLVISGVGFSTQSSNTVFVIWSDVRTVVADPSKTGMPANPRIGPNLPGVDGALVIVSKFFQYSLPAKQASYRGLVRADQYPYSLECPVMDVHFSTNNTPSAIVADGGILINDLRDQGRATGAHAVYNTASGLIHLTGEPHWQDALGRQGWAKEFILDRNAGVVHANDDARAILPGKSIGLGNLNVPGQTRRPKESTNSLYEVRAGRIQFDLGGSQTNTSGVVVPKARHSEAHVHVVLTNEVERTWASGDDMNFSESAGLLRLSGRARWLMGEDEIEGDVIEANRITRTLSARSNAVVRVPSRLLRVGGISVQAGSEPRASARGMIEIRADDFFWQTNVATFTGRVHVLEFEEGEKAARLDCHFLQLTFDETNQIQRMLARGGVDGEEFATRTRPSTLRAGCEILNVWWYPGGKLLKRVEAEQNVKADQTLGGQPRKMVRRHTRAGRVWWNFSSQTNRIDTAMAEEHVLLSQSETERDATNAVLQQVERGAEGDRADYHAEPAGQGLVLTGQPLGWLIKTNLATRKFSAQIITNASSLTWSAVNGSLRGRGRYAILPLKPGEQPR